MRAFRIIWKRTRLLDHDLRLLLHFNTVLGRLVALCGAVVVVACKQAKHSTTAETTAR